VIPDTQAQVSGNTGPVAAVTPFGMGYRPEPGNAGAGRISREDPGQLEINDGPHCESTLDRIEALAVRLARFGGLDPDGAHFLGVALREAIVNALHHGRGAAWVALRLARRGVLVMTVRDRGPGFDPSRLPDPRAPENVVKGCGRGIFYMRRFTDRVSFSFPRQGGAVVRLEKRVRSYSR
jgi:serine/threonine-protein kinase RsbW